MIDKRAKILEILEEVANHPPVPVECYVDHIMAIFAEPETFLYAHEQLLEKDGKNLRFITLTPHQETTLDSTKCLGKIALLEVEL